MKSRDGRDEGRWRGSERRHRGNGRYRLPTIAGRGSALVWLGWLLCALVVGALALPAFAANADGGAPNLAYVAGGGSDGNQLVVIDIGAKHISWRLTLSGRPHSVLLATDARTAYVTVPSKNALDFVDASGHSVSASVSIPDQPAGMALDLASSPHAVYVAESGGSAIAEVNLDTQRVAATITVGNHPTGLAVAAAGSGIPDANDPEVFVANTGDNTVSIVGTHERKVLATVPVPGGPLNVTIPGVGGIAYVTTQSGTVQAIDIAHRALLGAVLQTPGDALGAMDYDAVTGQIYVPDATTNAVLVLAPVTSTPVYANGTTSNQFNVPHEPARVLKGFPGASAVAITFEGAYGFITESASGQVAMLDAGTNAVLARLAVGGKPQSVITGANPPLIGPQFGLIFGVIVLALIIAMPIYLLLSERRFRRKRAASEAAGGKVSRASSGKSAADAGEQ